MYVYFRCPFSRIVANSLQTITSLSLPSEWEAPPSNLHFPRLRILSYATAARHAGRPFLLNHASQLVQLTCPMAADLDELWFPSLERLDVTLIASDATLFLERCTRLVQLNVKLKILPRSAQHATHLFPLANTLDLLFVSAEEVTPFLHLATRLIAIDVPFSLGTFIPPPFSQLRRLSINGTNMNCAPLLAHCSNLLELALEGTVVDDVTPRMPYLLRLELYSDVIIPQLERLLYIAPRLRELTFHAPAIAFLRLLDFFQVVERAGVERVQLFLVGDHVGEWRQISSSYPHQFTWLCIQIKK